MTELIKITTNEEGAQVVSARELHKFLEVGKVFGAWITERIGQFGFIENQDYVVYSEIGNNPKGGRPTKEYILSIDMAKELSMIERSDKGKQARLYFIECEKRLKEVVSKPMTTAQMFALQAQALLEIEQRQNEQDERIRRLEENQRENEAALKAIPLEDVTLPELPERQQINQLARLYAGSTGVSFRDVWNKVYQELYYRFNISIRAHKKNLGETSYLDVAERIGCLDKIKNILNHLISKLELK